MLASNSTQTFFYDSFGLFVFVFGFLLFFFVSLAHVQEGSFDFITLTMQGANRFSLCLAFHASFCLFGRAVFSCFGFVFWSGLTIQLTSIEIATAEPKIQAFVTQAVS